MVGRNGISGEKSVAVTNGGSGVRLDIDYSGRAPTGILRIYRGTSTGSYSAYIDLHAYNIGRVYDNGIAVNGYPWISRSPGAVDSINSIGESSVEIDGNLAKFVATTSPTVGSWTQADKIEHSNAAASGKIGRVCVTPGGAGVFVFKTWGPIDA
ncbi:hypothetical protein D9M71_641110 [compost metagenome]